MSSQSYLEKMLDGAEVAWLPLGDVAKIKRGSSITKKDVTYGEIPVIAGGRKPAYFHNVSNREGQTIVIAGSGAYAVFVSWWNQPIFVSDAFTVQAGDGLMPRYCYHFLLGMQKLLYELKSGGGVPHLYPRDVSPIQIPIPCPDDPSRSLKIQAEIVRILDAFTSLTAELTAELTARKKQYNYYRNQRPTFSDHEASFMPLSDCCLSIADGDHQAPPKSNTGIPFITISNVSNKGRIDFTDTKFVPEAYYNKLADKRKARTNDILYTVVGSFGIPVLIENDDKFAFQRHIAILRPDKKVIAPKYLYHALQSSAFLLQAHSVATGAAQKTITLTTLNKMQLPVPSPEEQARIVSILDTFDALTNSISEGLPREIELRQKQYEYYRDVLLTFPKAPETFPLLQKSAAEAGG